MVNRKEIENILLRSRKNYDRCWKKLILIKKMGRKRFGLKELIQFQVDLGKTQYILSKKHSEIVEEKKIRISRKEKYNNAWFVRRMRTLSNYEYLVNTYILIGKAVGDAFGWLFYSKEKELLIKHLNHQQQFYFPIGVGGIGEIEFIKKNYGIKK